MRTVTVNASSKYEILIESGILKDAGKLIKEQAHEQMLNIPSYQRNTNQNHNEVSSQADQNGHHQKV